MISIKYLETKDRNTDEFHVRRKDRNNRILFSEVFSTDNQEFFYPYSIEIETVNRCNNTCSFCAVNIHNDTRKYARMTDEMFHDIICQLSEMDYSGYLSLFSNNEPLLDKRICSFAEYARKQLPKARLALFTNGILMTTDIFLRLVKNIDYLVIDNYSDSMELIPSVARVLKEMGDRDFHSDIKVFIRKKTQILSSRGGEAPNRTNTVKYEGGCMMPLMQIVIRPDGKISKCCQDGLGLSCYGDLFENSLMECWNSLKRKHLWEVLNTEGRGSVEGCMYCDVFGHDNYIPPEWRPLIINSFLKTVARAYMKKKSVVLMGDSNFCFQMERFLSVNGFRGIRYCNGSEPDILENEFYILQDYDEGFLDRIDRYAQYAGEKWLVAEKVLIYGIHSSAIMQKRFLDYMAAVFQNRAKDMAFVGTEKSCREFERLVNPDRFCHLHFSECKNVTDWSNRFVVFESTAEGGLNDFLKLTGIDKTQILDYREVAEFIGEL